MRSLYPDIKPFDRQMPEVGDGHQLYVDQSGILVTIRRFLHGGPGNGCEFDSRRSSIQTSTTLFCLISEVQGARYRQVRFTPIRWII